eukprot:TRINITY_DN5514_c0_g1_i2.p1 TRINITY_DN5514_c0_g1~~TRINITY_DN5514_c0_g1_i2.p1  ORF type:complete len:667 (-),score=70.82 TRINITY_DN5514_c0_g1_i2:573-2573(-)
MKDIDVHADNGVVEYEKMSLSKLKNDMICLYSMWFNQVSGDDHAARLESFYSPQAHAYDRFRKNFLWGRKPLLAACAARLEEQTDMVWVDLGGGTGENVDMMSEYLPLDKFKAIYVVDLCHSLCEVAKKKAVAKGWKNVIVVEADACTFEPRQEHGMATLVTFSYSLSMIPPFYGAVDKALEYLDPHGFLGIADFYVSGKWDLPMRQMSWARRFFWRSIFDQDGIDLGPERRMYLDHKLERMYELNSQGSIPYVPYLRAPWYVWLGQKHAEEQREDRHGDEAKVEAPPLFPPTFLYTQSWEDPDPDMKVLQINNKDVVLTLTSGGCNSLNYLIHGAAHVVSVDCNPAQSALLELKAVGIKRLEYDDFWLLFGEGKHPNIEELYSKELAPWLSQTSRLFWDKRLNYFKQGLYYQGGMGKVCWMLAVLCSVFGLTQTRIKIANAATMDEQRRLFNNLLLVRILKSGPQVLVAFMIQLLTFVFLNRFVMWFGGGVPLKQLDLIKKDDVHIGKYVARTFEGVAQNSHVKKHNYFYYNCLMGKFIKENCPNYLKEDNFKMLKDGAIERLSVVTGTFMAELTARKYNKVILMDHVDWLDEQHGRELAATLARQIPAGGRVIWRSASLNPPYAKLIQEAGFEVQQLQRADQGYMDRVNMYSSFFVAVRKLHQD